MCNEIGWQRDGSVLGATPIPGPISHSSASEYGSLKTPNQQIPKVRSCTSSTITAIFGGKRVRHVGHAVSAWDGNHGMINDCSCTSSIPSFPTVLAHEGLEYGIERRV